MFWKQKRSTNIMKSQRKFEFISKTISFRYLAGSTRMCIWKGPGRLPQNLGPNCHYHPLKPFLLWNHEENHSRTHVFTEDLWQCSNLRSLAYSIVFFRRRKTQTAMKGAPWGALPLPLAAPWTSLRTTWARIGRSLSLCFNAFEIDEIN